MPKSSDLGIDLPFLAPERSEVVQAKMESDDTISLIISLPANYQAWRPGQFNMIYLFGLGEVPISISGEQPGTNYITHTIKAVGPVTRALTHLTPGEKVWIRGPFGVPWPALPSKGTLLLIAGGIGLAPLRSVILAALKEESNTKLILLYGARNPADVLFRDELAQWSDMGRCTVHVTVDRVEASDQWEGSIGVVTHLMQQLDSLPIDTRIMTCGPDVMIRHVVSELASMGLSDEAIYVSLERNMKCAVGLCGRCQWGQHFICRDGPVYRLADVRQFWTIRDL